MVLAVDFVSGDPIPKYSQAILHRLRNRLDVRTLLVRSHGSTQVRVSYQLLEHILWTRLKRRRGSVLHVDSQMLGYILAAPARAPTVLTCHDIVPLLPEFDDPSYVSRTRIVDRLSIAMLRRGLRNAGRIMADSNHTRDDLIRLGCDRDRVDVVYMGVDLDAYKPRETKESREVLTKYGIPPSRPIVLFVGSEHPRKNIPALFRAFEQIQRESRAVLVKVGQPRQPQRQSLIDLARNLGISGDVIFLDAVAEEDMPLLYSTSDVLVLPSLYEGFGLPPLEAMACGTPVVVSRATSLPEVVGDAGLMIDPRDPGGIADAVLRVMADSGLREKLRTRGLDRARQFGWSRTVEGVIRSYREAQASSLA